MCDSIDVFGFSCAPPHTGHSKPVRGLAFAAGGHALLSASDDQRVNVHEMCVRDSVDKRRRVERRGPRLTDSSPTPPNQPTGAGTPWSRPTTGTRRGCWAWRPPPTAATSPRGALRWLWARERIVDWMAPSERYRFFTPRMNRQRGGPAREAVGPGHEGLRAHHRPVRWVRHDLMSTHSMHTTKPNPHPIRSDRAALIEMNHTHTYTNTGTRRRCGAWRSTPPSPRSWRAGRRTGRCSCTTWDSSWDRKDRRRLLGLRVASGVAGRMTNEKHTK